MTLLEFSVSFYCDTDITPSRAESGLKCTEMLAKMCFVKQNSAQGYEGWPSKGSMSKAGTTEVNLGMVGKGKELVSRAANPEGGYGRRVHKIAKGS